METEWRPVALAAHASGALPKSHTWVCVGAGCCGYPPLKETFSNKQHLLVYFSPS